MVGEFWGRKLLGCRYFDGIALISLYEDDCSKDRHGHCITAKC